MLPPSEPAGAAAVSTEAASLGQAATSAPGTSRTDTAEDASIVNAVSAAPGAADGKA